MQHGYDTRSAAQVHLNLQAVISAEFASQIPSLGSERKGLNEDECSAHGSANFGHFNSFDSKCTPNPWEVVSMAIQSKYAFTGDDEE